MAKGDDDEVPGDDADDELLDGGACGASDIEEKQSNNEEVFLSNAGRNDTCRHLVDNDLGEPIFLIFFKTPLPTAI